MVNTVEQAARKPRRWGMIAAALLVAGIGSFILFAFVWQANADAHSKHPCPIPPVPWQVWATWWLAFSALAAAVVCLATTVVTRWRTNKAIAVVCLLGGALTVLPFTLLADTYGSTFGGRVLESSADPLICDGDHERGAG